MKNGRTQKSLINILAGTGYQMFSIVMNFVSRTIFIYMLGSGFLGINGLFSNILSVLSLAELGVGTAMNYCLYEPLAKGDKSKITALTQYFKVIYRIIACVVFGLGISVVPFLKYIVNLETTIPRLSLYYILFLADTVVSYLCTYKSAILTADQKNYILQIFRACFDIIRIVIQILILLIYKNYFIYLVVQITCSILMNIMSAKFAERQYPFIRLKAKPLGKEEKEKIWSNIRAMFSYKVGGVILNNTDQLLISILVSTEYVGLYSNYYLPIKSVMGITSAVFIAVQSSVGNLAVEKNKRRQYEIFQILDNASFWLYGIFTVGFCVMLQDFISLWLGDKYLLSNSLVYIISITYYLTGVLYPIWCYRETVGLFQHTKNIMFYTAAVNVILSIVWGRKFGIEGILVATVVARLLTNVWYEPYKLFDIFFKKPVFTYYLNKVVEGAILALLVMAINYISTFIIIENAFVHFLVKGIICVAITNVVIVLYLYRQPGTAELISKMQSILLKKIRKQ